MLNVHWGFSYVCCKLGIALARKLYNKAKRNNNCVSSNPTDPNSDFSYLPRVVTSQKVLSLFSSIWYSFKFKSYCLLSLLVYQVNCCVPNQFDSNSYQILPTRHVTGKTLCYYFIYIWGGSDIVYWYHRAILDAEPLAVHHICCFQFRCGHFTKCMSHQSVLIHTLFPFMSCHLEFSTSLGGGNLQPLVAIGGLHNRVPEVVRTKAGKHSRQPWPSGGGIRSLQRQKCC